MSDPWSEHVRKVYASNLGRPARELVTPALVLDLHAAKRNLGRMVEQMGGRTAKLRPHVKGQKCVELAKMQVQAGAIGVCTATVWEAAVMSRAGIEDVLIANQVVGRQKIRTLAQAAERCRLTTAVDHPRHCDLLEEAMTATGGRLEVLIEIDVGMGRGGVRSVADAVTVARHIAKLKHVRFRGLQAYEGHCMMEPDREARIGKARQAADLTGEVIGQLAKAGFKCEVVSGGGTGTYEFTGADPRYTELQAGSYLLMDMFHGKLVSGFEQALTVMTTVVVRQGKTVVLDCGSKSICTDEAGTPMKPFPFYKARDFHEEHALFDVDDRCDLSIGDTVELIPGYSPSTINMYDVYHVVENGVVVDIWPVIPRGPGHGGWMAGATS
ncbi:MAG: DSD1 family PLP-dependent enzyme [Phycisphaeraceae bacterium]|nr:DSD1 family PLP-dependent enzyme [Phycisphaeraceae bacterium]